MTENDSSGRGRSRWVWMIILGGLLTLAGGVTTVISFFQPWRTCADDDAADACPMLPLDFQIMNVALVATLIGIMVLTAGIVLHVTHPLPARAGLPARPNVNALAIISLAVFVIPPAPIICGHIALSQIKKRGQRGRDIAVAGLILGYGGLLTIIVVAWPW